MYQKSGLRAGLEGLEPAQQLFSIGVVAELFQRRHARTNGHLFREDAHRLGAAFDDLAPGARRLEADKDHLGAWIREPLHQMMREKKIHVVAAEKDVLADRDPLERQVSAFFLHFDEREEKRSACYRYFLPIRPA